MKVVVFGKNSLKQERLLELISQKTGVKIISRNNMLRDREVTNLENFILSGYPNTTCENEFMKKSLFKPDLVIFFDENDKYKDEESYCEYLKLYSISNSYLYDNTIVWKIDLDDDIEKISDSISEYILYILN